MLEPPVPDVALPASAAGTLSFTVTVNGTAIADRVEAIEIWSAVKTLPRARLMLGGDLADAGADSTSQRNFFLHGMPIEIAAGYGGLLRTLFRGAVARNTLRLAQAAALWQVVDASGDVTDGEVADVAVTPAFVAEYGVSILHMAVEVADAGRPPKVSGSVAVQGSAAAGPGATITLAGLGKGVDGPAFVRTVHHAISGAQWTTTFKLGLPDEAAVPTPAREPELPNTRELVTARGIRLRLDDETGVVQLTTPAGQSVTVDDRAGSITLRDSSLNTITLSRAGIQLCSKSDLLLQAGGDIVLDAGSSLRVAASNTASVQAAGVVLAADASLSLKAAGAAELTASGIVTVQGTLVKIN